MSDKDKKPPTAQEISSACESNKHNKQGKVGSAETSSCGLVKLKSYYEDRWTTPMAGATFDLYVNGKKVLSKARLAGYDHPEWEPGTFVYEVPEQGQVNFVITSEHKEQIINNLKVSIRESLGQPYKTLVQSMKPYQQEWDNNPSIAGSAYKGAKAAASDAGDSIADMFSTDFWKDIGSDIKGFAIKTYAVAEDAAVEQIIEMDKAWKETHYEIKNMGFKVWFEKEMHEAKDNAHEHIQKINKEIDQAKADLEELGEDIKGLSKDAKVIFKHRKKILDLPNMILESRVDDIEIFLDTVVKEIAPEIYQEIIEDEQWQSTIELIYDREAIGLPLTYLQAMLTAIPPNFYLEKFSYLGITIIIEVVLFIILAILGGAGAAARLTALIARIKNVADKGEKGASALKAFVAMLEAFAKSISKIKDAGKGLIASRRGSSRKGATAGTIHNPRRKEEKPKKCKKDPFRKLNTTYVDQPPCLMGDL